jgi:Predicted nucleic acid-binding protein, contains PIN domain
MDGIIVDSSVLLDVLGKDPTWYHWSCRQLERFGDQQPLLINTIIYAELSIGYDALEQLEDALIEIGVQLLEIPREALFLAGKAFLQYRKKGGARIAPLPDFFIGAHAAVTRLPLLTRDTRRVQRYFPTVELIYPKGRKN